MTQLRDLIEEDQGWHREAIPHLDKFAYMSASKIKYIQISMWAFYRRYILGHKPKETPAKKFGRVVHKALLEPDDFLGRYVIEKSFSGTGSRAAKSDWLESQAHNAIILKQDQADQILYMIDSLQKNARACEIMKGAAFEVNGYYYNQRLGMWFYGVVDILKSQIVSDFKTARSASTRGFYSALKEYGYHIQAAIYVDMAKELNGMVIDEFPFIVIENQEPYHTMVHWLPQHMIEAGRNHRDIATKKFKKQMLSYADDKNIVWPGYEGLTEIKNPKIPGYITQQMESESEAHYGE